jgi:hypothetical protein
VAGVVVPVVVADVVAAAAAAAERTGGDLDWLVWGDWTEEVARGEGSTSYGDSMPGSVW